MEGTNIGRALWLAERRKGIGGTDAAAIVGVNPFSTAYEVWLEKRGEAPEREDTEPMWWGRELEDLIARRYTEKTGRLLTSPGHLAHPDYPFLLATPDRVVIGEPIGVEIKTARLDYADQWGTEGTDEIPEHYLVQVCHYMAVTGFQHWDVAVLLGGSDFRIYTVHAPKTLLDSITDTLARWWQHHVVGGVQPEITGAKSTREMIHARFPHDLAPVLDARSLSPVQAEWADENLAALIRSRSRFFDAKRELDAIENNLKAFIGESGGVKGSKVSVTWRATRARRSVDWEAVARRFAPSPIELEHAIEDHTEESPGVRRFLVREGGR